MTLGVLADDVRARSILAHEQLYRTRILINLITQLLFIIVVLGL
jgi:hypothetical protein